ncbi:hypothetical protein HYT59_01400 [Candidatus Woesebacteria bacterium]|nr:hypothetical protein [Candidatus Woesebacteria bacterium]
MTTEYLWPKPPQPDIELIKKEESRRVKTNLLQKIREATNPEKIFSEDLSNIAGVPRFAIANVRFPKENPIETRHITDAVRARKGTKERKYRRIKGKKEIQRIKDQFDVGNLKNEEIVIFRPCRKSAKNNTTPFVLVAQRREEINRVVFYICPHLNIKSENSESKLYSLLESVPAPSIEELTNRIRKAQQNPRTPIQIFPLDGKSFENQQKLAPAHAATILKSNLEIPPIIWSLLFKQIDKDLFPELGVEWGIYFDKSNKFLWEITPFSDDLPRKKQPCDNFRIRIYYHSDSIS